MPGRQSPSDPVDIEGDGQSECRKSPHLGRVERRTTLTVVGGPVAEDVLPDALFMKSGECGSDRFDLIEEPIHVVTNVDGLQLFCGQAPASFAEGRRVATSLARRWLWVGTIPKSSVIRSGSRSSWNRRKVA